jgi:uncharacterized paraquat-inducible protein A
MERAWRNVERGRRMTIDRKEVAVTSAVVIALVFAMLVYIPFSIDGFMAKLKLVLGAAPMGLKLELYVVLFLAVLCLPLPFFLWHTVIVLHHAKENRDRLIHVGLIGTALALLKYMGCLLRNDHETETIRRSKIVTFCGILYVIGIAAWWIVWAEAHGI